jgi:hypothetical protein
MSDDDPSPSASDGDEAQPPITNTGKQKKKKSSDASTKPKTSKKRKHSAKKKFPEEQYQIECADRYEKLRHTSTKHLHREAKVVKSFECQKIVRAIKTAKEAVDSQQTQQIRGDVNDKKAKKLKENSARALKKLKTLEKKLEWTKKFDLDVLVQVGLKRLGIHALKHIGDGVGGEDCNGNADGTMPDQCDDPFYQALLEDMLQHKRLSNAVDQLNEKVTEFRSWSTHRQELLQGGDGMIDSDTGGKKKKKKSQQQSGGRNETLIVAGGASMNNRQRRRGLDLAGHEGTSGLFIGSLSGAHFDGYDEMGEGEDDYEDYNPVETKKNRPGQRARKAKAMAIEARKAGKNWDSSVNWRETKADKGEHGRSDDIDRRGRGDGKRDKSMQNKTERSRTTSVKPAKAEQIATMGKTWKEEGNAHPSWAAKAAQKSQGIAKFSGTKITFD